MSSRIPTTLCCLDVALDHLHWLARKTRSDIEVLERDIILLKAVVLCAKKGRKSCHFYRDDYECEIWGYISFRIEDVVSRIPIDLYSAYLASPLGEDEDDDFRLLETEINRQSENIEFLWTDIKEPFISLLDNHYPTGDPDFLMDIFDSLSEFRFHYNYDGIFETLTFLRDFSRILIRSPTMMGVNRIHLTDRLIQVEIVAVKVLRLICINSFERANYNKEEHSNMKFEISEVINKDLHSAYLASATGGAFIGTSRDACYSNLDWLETEISRQRENIEFLWTDIKEGCISLLDNHYPTGDPEFLTYIFDSLFEFRFYYDEGDIVVPLTFLRDFFRILIHSATMMGLNRMHLTDRLIQVEIFALKLVRLMCISWFERDSYSKMEFEISQVIKKDLIGAMLIDADPQARQTYIHVLKASTYIFSPEEEGEEEEEEEPSTHIFIPKKKGHIVPSNFIRLLMYQLMDLPTYDTGVVMLFLKLQMQQLHQGLSFLQILFEAQYHKFDALADEMKHLILAAVIDAGIVISSLSVNEPKEGLSKEIHLALLHLLEALKLIMAEVEQIYPPTSLAFTFPANNELGSFDFLLENLKELTSCEADSIAFLKDQIHVVQEDLVFLRSFLENILKQRNQNKELQALWNRVIEVGCKAEFVIDSIIVGVKSDCSLMPLVSISEEIKLLMTAAPEIYERVRLDIQAQTVAKSFTRMPSQVTAPKLNEILVGHDEEVKTVIDQLTRGSQQLDVVSVVGMAGLGKTTLANKVYNDPSINSHFYIRAWCTVSQVYSEHSLILQILGDTVSESNEHDLAMKLYQRLKGNRYLIVLDDVWEVAVLNLLQNSFPDDNNGSRILLTSRVHDLCSSFKSSNKPHDLRPLSDEECWELLQKTVFRKGDCPPTLSVVGENIAKSCKGLPLTVVVVAGILANIELDCWEDVANSLSSSTVIAAEHCMKTLELSYRHLPDYLKSCLLYFGAFKEDQNIPVRRLLQLWISEGFVLKNGGKRLEDVAEEYLVDLIGRSLVMVTQQRSRGGAKACRVHDLLHEFCVAKAKEESFLLILDSNYKTLISSGYNCHRLCPYADIPEMLENETQLYFPHLRSLLLFRSHLSFQLFSSGSCSKTLFIFRMFKLLRVLDIGDFMLEGGDFPREVESLVHLRYLAIRSKLKSLPSGIAKLSKLETFLILSSPFYSVSSIALPNTIWNMKKLRHLWCLGGFEFPTDNLEVSPDLYHLETLTLAMDHSSQSFQKIIRKLPSIRRLKLFKPIESCKGVIVPDDLSRLESLRVGFPWLAFRDDAYNLLEFAFPRNLKKLTLDYYRKPWSEISTIAKLPHLEVLKLLARSFEGETWELKEGEFPKLRFLKLKHLDICWWTTVSFDNFPNLEKLVLQECKKLKGVPAYLGEIPTLEMIEVRECCESAIHSVEQIQDEQMNYGNEVLKIVIHRSGDSYSYSDSDSDSTI